jgi:hypothetical protein
VINGGRFFGDATTTRATFRCWRHPRGPRDVGHADRVTVVTRPLGLAEPVPVTIA